MALVEGFPARLPQLAVDNRAPRLFPWRAGSNARAPEPNGHAETMTAADRRDHLAGRLAAVARGDRDALHDIYELTSAKLLGVVLRILHDREEAEDVLQDVYVAVWNRADRFDPARASPITWLATIARNRAIDRLRALGPRRFATSIDEAGEMADDGPDPLARLEMDDEARALRRCLETLEDRARASIVSAFFEGRTYEEIAARERVPLGTMKSTIRRGLIRLKGCLQP